MDPVSQGSDQICGQFAPIATYYEPKWRAIGYVSFGTEISFGHLQSVHCSAIEEALFSCLFHFERFSPFGNFVD